MAVKKAKRENIYASSISEDEHDLKRQAIREEDERGEVPFRETLSSSPHIRENDDETEFIIDCID